MNDRDNEKDARKFEEANPEHRQSETEQDFPMSQQSHEKQSAAFWRDFDALVASRSIASHGPEEDPYTAMVPRNVRAITMQRVTHVECDGLPLVTLSQDGGIKDTRYTMTHRQKLALLSALIVDAYDCCICDSTTTCDELLFNLDQRLGVLGVQEK